MRVLNNFDESAPALLIEILRFKRDLGAGPAINEFCVARS